MFLFILITILSAVFRITNLSLIEFKGDEAIALFLAAQPIFGHSLPPGATVSSVGILNPPIFIYLLFPLVIFTRDPQIISGIIGLINTFSIGFLFLVLKKYYGKTTALVACILLALSPWSILYSRKIWTQDLILPFAVLLFYSLHKLFIEKQSKFWFLYVFTSIILLQLHQSLIFFLIPLSLGLLLKKVKFNFKYIILGLIIGFIPLIPYIVFEITNHFPDYQIFTHVGGRLAVVRSTSLFFRPFQILNQGNFRYIMGDDISSFALQFPLAYKLRYIFYLEYALLAFGVFVFWKQYKDRRFLVYSTILLPIIYFLLRIEPLMHYFIILTPLLFLFVATGLSYLCQKKTFLKVISVVLFILLLITSIVYDYSFFSFLSKNGAFNGDYGTIYARTRLSNESRLKKYVHSKEYDEMLLASYLPMTFFQGELPLSKMLYDQSETEKELPQLEMKLGAEPEDSRVRLQLFSYYTQVLPTRETINLLRQKSSTIPGYIPIYKEAYMEFLNKRFKKKYVSPEMGMVLEVPAHWDIGFNDDKLAALGDGYILTIARNKNTCSNFQTCALELQLLADSAYKNMSENIFTQSLDIQVCLTNNGKWCGILYKPFVLNGRSVFILFMPQSLNSFPNASDENLRKALETLHDILQSIRPIDKLD